MTVHGRLPKPSDVAFLAQHGFTPAQLGRGRAVLRRSDRSRGRIVRSNVIALDVVTVLWRPHTFKSDPWGDRAEPINIRNIEPAAKGSKP
jgi:hypothetical protein